MWERKQRNPELCLQLLKRGQSLNPTDPAIYQVRHCVVCLNRDVVVTRALVLYDAHLLLSCQAWAILWKRAHP